MPRTPIEFFVKDGRSNGTQAIMKRLLGEWLPHMVNANLFPTVKRATGSTLSQLRKENVKKLPAVRFRGTMYQGLGAIQDLVDQVTTNENHSTPRKQVTYSSGDAMEDALQEEAFNAKENMAQEESQDNNGGTPGWANAFAPAMPMDDAPGMMPAMPGAMPTQMPEDPPARPDRYDDPDEMDEMMREMLM